MYIDKESLIINGVNMGAYLTQADFEYNKIGIPKPDMVIYLDMPVEISQKLMITLS